MISYDPRGHTWDAWQRLMIELFSQHALGYCSEDNWKQWATRFSGIPNVAKSGIPDARHCDNWQSWASALTGTLNIPKR